MREWKIDRSDGSRLSTQNIIIRQAETSAILIEMGACFEKVNEFAIFQLLQHRWLEMLTVSNENDSYIYMIVTQKKNRKHCYFALPMNRVRADHFELIIACLMRLSRKRVYTFIYTRTFPVEEAYIWRLCNVIINILLSAEQLSTLRVHWLRLMEIEKETNNMDL